MERVTPRLLVAWLIGALALSVAIVGCGTITSQDPPLSRVVSAQDYNDTYSRLEECTMSNGDAGLQFDDLCLPAPPAGWTGIPQGMIMTRDENGRMVPLGPGMLKPASFLELPDTGGCKSGSGAAFVEI